MSIIDHIHSISIVGIRESIILIDRPIDDNRPSPAAIHDHRSSNIIELRQSLAGREHGITHARDGPTTTSSPRWVAQIVARSEHPLEHTTRLPVIFTTRGMPVQPEYEMKTKSHCASLSSLRALGPLRTNRKRATSMF